MRDDIRNEEALRQMQARPLDMKEAISRNRIYEWVEAFGASNIVVSFSGGKDSTVLLHLARKHFPDIKAVFSNTGLEYPEIQQFVKSFDNVDIVTPTMNFAEIITTYGYPLISKEIAAAVHYARRIIPAEQSASKQYEKGYKATVGYRKQFMSAHWTKEDGTVERSQFQKANWLPLVQLPVLISEYCCFKTKKSPIKQYVAKNRLYPMLGTLAEESRLRKQSWIKDGCNVYEGRNKESKPLSIWTEQDILQYIVLNDVKIASVYGDIVGADRHGMNYPPKNEDGEITRRLRCTGCDRTGCIYCAFGLHLERGETRFQRLARTHPRHYEYCMGGGEWIDNPHYDPTAPKMDGDWENWNPKKIWSRTTKGLGMKKLFDMVNEIYGKAFIKYE